MRGPRSYAPLLLRPLVGCVVLFGGSALAAPQAELSLAAGVDGAYDDNVYNGRGPDFVNRITPHGAFKYEAPRLTIDAQTDLSYWTYALGKAQNSLNFRFIGGIEGRPSRRLTLKLTDEFARAEDPGFLSRAAVVAPQIGIVNNIADALVGYAVTHRLYSAVGYTLQTTSFDDYSYALKMKGITPLYDGAEHDAQLMNSFRVTRTDDLHVAGRFQFFSGGPQSVSPFSWNLGASYSPGLGWRHLFLRELDANVDGGPVFYEALGGSKNVPAPASSGVTYRLAAAIRWNTPSWRSSVTFTRDLLGATGIGSAVWGDYAYAQITYVWHERFDAHVGGGYFRNGRAVDQPTAYDGVTGDAMLDWHLIQNLRLGAYYTVRWQETGPGAIPPGAVAAQFPSVIRNIVGLRLTAVFGADARPPRREVHE